MGFISFADSLRLSRDEARKLARQYINPGLVTMMGLLNFDKQFTKAQGVSVWDKDGREYLDFLGGYGALNLGHNPPEVIEALQAVMERPNILQVTINPFAAALAANLAAVTPGDLERVFFCNSGTEAVEGALKLARAYSRKPTILYMDGAFHGKTLGSLSVSGREKYRKPFQPLLSGCEQIPFGDAAALEKRLQQGDVAAVIVEPIQGENGIKVPPDGYLATMRELCNKHEALMIADEVQTGFGRTGKLFGCEHENVVPDIMCLAKSLSGSMVPIGAVIARPTVWDKVYGGMENATLHTSTFGGNTLACAAGLAALETIINRRLPERTAELGNYFLEQTRKLAERHPVIKEVRGRGLLIGIEFKEREGLADRLTGGKLSELAREYYGAMVAGSLLNDEQVITVFTLNNPNVIRLEPPLIVTKEQIDQVLAALDRALGKTGSLTKAALTTAKSMFSGLLKRN